MIDDLTLLIRYMHQLCPCRCQKDFPNDMLRLHEHDSDFTVRQKNGLLKYSNGIEPSIYFGLWHKSDRDLYCTVTPADYLKSTGRAANQEEGKMILGMPSR